MTKDDFIKLLRHSTAVAYDFAKEHVIEELPNDFKYSVTLNASFDDPNLLPQFDIYPSDNNKKVELIDEKTVVELLYRKGKIPVWIDINVLRVHKGKTIINLLCSGRYSDNFEEYYYRKGGTGSFGIKSPILPFDYIKGKKFELKIVPKKSFFNWLKFK